MSFAGRPYAQLGIAELESLVQDAPDGRATNEAILAELRYRKVARAQALQKRLEGMLASADAIPARPMSTPAVSAPSPVAPVPKPRPAAPLPERETKGVVKTPTRQGKPIRT